MFYARILGLLVVLLGACLLDASETTFIYMTQPQTSVPGNPQDYSLLQNKSSGAYLVTNSTFAADLVHFNPGDMTIVATALYNETMLELGWDYLYVAIPQATSYYEAGYLEGYITADSISLTSVATLYSSQPQNVQQWIDSHVAYMTLQSLGAPPNDPFWSQVGLLLQQIQGLADGYNKKTGKELSFMDMFTWSFRYEIGGVTNMLNNVPLSYYAKPPERHCSALVKVTNDDLYVAHDTWSSFESMRRQYKVYAFGTTVAMSGYAGQIASGDDWYMTSNGFAIQETTNEFYNDALYQFISNRTVSEFLRVMAATYLATTGEEWVQLFAFNNSGTYNNQYMVVNMNLWKPGMMGASLANGTLWIAEQIPGYVEYADVTDILRATGYWASYNIPYFPYIYNVSGFLANEEAQGTFWSYTQYARPEIFRRNQSMISDLGTMQLMMRYNNFADDPLSAIPNCSGCPSDTCNPVRSAMLTIASRGDLNPPDNTTVNGQPLCYGPLYHFTGFRDHTATDAKIAAWSNFQNGQLTGIAISGPTAVQQPYFDWSAFGPAPPGMPQVYNFTWVSFALPTPWWYTPPRTGLAGDNNVIAAVLSSVGVLGLAAGAAVVFVKRRKNASRMPPYTDLSARDPMTAAMARSYDTA